MQQPAHGRRAEAREGAREGQEGASSHVIHLCHFMRCVLRP